MNYETRTFTLGEYERDYIGTKEIRYCSYCGAKALRDDIGSSHNHRWEEEIIYFCNCENAEIEKSHKKNIGKLKNDIWKEEIAIKAMEKLSNNPVVNEMKLNHELKVKQSEIEEIKRKYTTY